MTPDDELLTVADVARRLRISVNLAQRLSARDNWPRAAFSTKTIRYTPEHVAAIVALYDRAGDTTPVKGLAGQTAASRRRAS